MGYSVRQSGYLPTGEARDFASSPHDKFAFLAAHRDASRYFGIVS